MSYTKNPMLRDATNPEDQRQRDALVARARKLRQEIHIDLNTIAYWNEYVRKPDEEPIDPDPDGLYQRCLDHLNKLLGPETN